ncbi:hypothetical protein ElyMa_004162800 [Elysia marginata]|uniref:C-type lectin domain-containing protein n=1 Tax=Elysia marginata TaxID=1093978 RepID=A0AAV4GIZ6_9GAST|nr:hypothetical protein ElyMa_004162800 [Elysia marginata]
MESMVARGTEIQRREIFLVLKTLTPLLPTVTTVLMLMVTTHAVRGYDPYLDLRLITQRTTAEQGRQLCRERGYDGLAVLRKQNAFQRALTITENYRTRNSEGVYIGGTLCPSQNKIMWDDGREASDDASWGNNPPVKKNKKPNVMLGARGAMWMVTLDSLKASLCGNYLIQPIQGRTYPGQQPDVIQSDSTAVTSSVNYFLLCVSLCGHDDICVAVEFNSDLLTCTTFRANSYSNLIDNPASKTFVKN